MSASLNKWYLTVGWLLLSTFTNAQPKTFEITVDDAVQIAIENHPSLAFHDLDIEMHDMKVGTALAGPDVNVTFEAPNGVEFIPNVSLPFDNPLVYAARRNVYKSQLALAKDQKKVKENDIEYQVRVLYNQCQYQKAILDVYAQKDSLYSAVQEINAVKLKYGDISELENLSTKSRYERVTYDRKNAQKRYKGMGKRLSLLLNTSADSLIVPASSLEKLNDDAFEIEADEIAGNPRLQVLNKEVEVRNQEIKLEKRKKLPGLMIGYFDQGPRNINKGEIYNFKAGITFPVFYWLNHKNVKAAELNLQKTAMQKRITDLELRDVYVEAFTSFNTEKENLNYYQNNGLLEANRMITVARQSYELGEISYIEFVQNVDHAFAIRTDYFRALKSYNESLLTLKYLAGF